MKHQLRDIEYFSEIAERGNVGRAAEALGLSQPALSKSLRRLEKSMQAKLVKRVSRGVELTAVGKELYSHVRRLRLSLDDMTRAVADLSLGRAGHLRIRTAPGYATYLLPVACAELLDEAPNVTFDIAVMVDRSQALAAVSNGELDLAVTTIRMPVKPELAMESLYDEGFAVYTSAEHRLARKRIVTLADMTQEKWAISATNADAHRYLAQAFSDAGLPPPRIAITSGSMVVRNLLVAKSNILGFTSRRIAREALRHYNFVELPVKELAYTRRIGVYYRREAYLPPIAKRFLEVLNKTASQMESD